VVSLTLSDFLSKKGANVNIQDSYGRSPLDLAILKDHNEIVTYLRSSNAVEIMEKPQILKFTEDISHSTWNILAQEMIGSTNPLHFHGPCEFDRRNASMTIDEFVRDYLSLNKPVIISGLTEKWKASNWTTLSRFIQDIGDINVLLNIIPYPDLYGKPVAESTSLLQFLTYMETQASTEQYPAHVFEPLEGRNVNLFKDKYKIPKIFHKSMDVKFGTLILGPPRSGAHVHFHNHAWNSLVLGEKRWFFFPPQYGFFSKDHVMKWFNENYESLRAKKELIPGSMFECTQFPGDTVFVPRTWAHAVLNVETSLALSYEWDGHANLEK